MNVGIDLVEHKDMQDKDDRFIQRILSSLEYAYYQTITSRKRQIEYLASRFACKEAIYKCFKSMEHPYRFSDISILNDEKGAPYIQMDLKDKELQVSLSHTDFYSVAVVISLP